MRLHKKRYSVEKTDITLDEFRDEKPKATIYY